MYWFSHWQIPVLMVTQPIGILCAFVLWPPLEKSRYDQFDDTKSTLLRVLKRVKWLVAITLMAAPVLIVLGVIQLDLLRFLVLGAIVLYMLDRAARYFLASVE